MAVTGKVRDLSNSLADYLNGALDTEGFTRVTIVMGDPEDRQIVHADAYRVLSAAEKRDAVSVPCIMIDMDAVQDGDLFGIGELETWVFMTGAIDVYAESMGQKMSIADFIQEELEDKSISWYSYSTTNKPTAANLNGTITFENIRVRYPKVFNQPNKALKHWANISFRAKVSRAKET